MKVGAAILAAGLTCSFLLAGCAAPEGNHNVKNSSRLGTESGKTVASLSAGTKTGGDAAVTPVSSEWYIRTDAQMYYGGSYNADESWLTGGTDSQQTVYITASGGSDAWVGIYTVREQYEPAFSSRQDASCGHSAKPTAAPFSSAAPLRKILHRNFTS